MQTRVFVTKRVTCRMTTRAEETEGSSEQIFGSEKALCSEDP